MYMSDVFWSFSIVPFNNLVNTKLGGTIQIKDGGVGCTFIVKVPIQQSDKVDSLIY
mgnify:CR=1 FL=1